MLTHKIQRSKFTPDEDEVLLNIVESMNNVCYKKVAKSFNQIMKKKHKSNHKRIPSALKERYFLITNKKTLAWDNVFEEKMLELASQGYSWSQISKMPIFKEGNFTNNFIKKQFQTCQRIKVRALTSYYLQSFAKLISDKTLQVIIRDFEINSMLERGILNENEFYLLKKSQPFFMMSRMDKQNHKFCLRKKQNKMKIFKEFELDGEGKQLAFLILKIDRIIKNIEVPLQKKEPLWKEDDDEETKKQNYSQTELSKEEEAHEVMETMDNLLNEAIKIEEENPEIITFHQFKSNFQFASFNLNEEDEELDFRIQKIFQAS